MLEHAQFVVLGKTYLLKKMSSGSKRTAKPIEVPTHDQKVVAVEYLSNGKISAVCKRIAETLANSCPKNLVVFSGVLRPGYLVKNDFLP